jgi:hypothetical protein
MVAEAALVAELAAVPDGEPPLQLASRIAVTRNTIARCHDLVLVT